MVEAPNVEKNEKIKEILKRKERRRIKGKLANNETKRRRCIENTLMDKTKIESIHMKH